MPTRTGDTLLQRVDCFRKSTRRTQAFSGSTIFATFSKSCRLMMLSRGGRASSRACLCFSSSVTSLTTLATVLASMTPRLEEGIRSVISRGEMEAWTYCFWGGRLVVMASGGWIGSYASLYPRSDDYVVCIAVKLFTHVASLPAYFKMILLPPGCSKAMSAEHGGVH